MTPVEMSSHPEPPPDPPGVIERWELLQAQDLSKELRTKQNQQKWQQLTSDLRSVWAWLGQAGEELEQQRRLELSTDIQTIQLRIKKLKVREQHPTFIAHELAPCLWSQLMAWFHATGW